MLSFFICRPGSISLSFVIIVNISFTLSFPCRYGQLFIADSDNHRVHLLLPDGKFSCFILNHQHKISHPVTVAIDNKGNLVVGEAFGHLKVFKYI